MRSLAQQWLALGEANEARHTPPLDWAALQSRVRDRPNREPFASVADYARAYRDGATTPEAVAEAALSGDDPPAT